MSVWTSDEGEIAVRNTDQSSNMKIQVKSARDDLEDKVTKDNVLVGPYECKVKLLKLINGGSFGQIFVGEKQDDDKCKVGVKIEHPGQIEQLLYEGQVYRKLEGGPGIATVFWYGMHGSLFNVLVMELLGKSLHELFVEQKHHFSLKTVLLLIDQMTDTIQFIHNQNFVHRDISASNFMMGIGANRHRLYLVDFGLAKKFSTSPVSFRPGHNRRGYMLKVSRPLVGTARFCSLNCHRGEEEGRRDDMESLGYVWLYFLKGKLPWQGMDASCAESKLEKIYNEKLATPLDELCHGLPEEFLTYMTFVRGMGQYDIPDYTAIKNLFQDLARKENIEYDYLYDWCDVEQCRELNENFLGCPERSISISSSSPSEGVISH